MPESDWQDLPNFESSCVKTRAIRAFSFCCGWLLICIKRVYTGARKKSSLGGRVNCSEGGRWAVAPSIGQELDLKEGGRRNSDSLAPRVSAPHNNASKPLSTRINNAQLAKHDASKGKPVSRGPAKQRPAAIWGLKIPQSLQSPLWKQGLLDTHLASPEVKPNDARYISTNAYKSTANMLGSLTVKSSTEIRCQFGISSHYSFQSTPVRHGVPNQTQDESGAYAW
jgi:hypothetical protein